MCKAVHSIAVPDDAVAFDVVQHAAHLLRRVVLVVQELDEVGDGTLEVDVVFPERIVSINQQVLCAIAARCHPAEMITRPAVVRIGAKSSHQDEIPPPYRSS